VGSQKWHGLPSRILTVILLLGGYMSDGISVQIEQLQPVQYEIIKEILTAMDRLGAKSGLVSPISSWGDTLPQADVLSMLKEWNARQT
jgi:hypothetical protein